MASNSRQKYGSSGSRRPQAAGRGPASSRSLGGSAPPARRAPSAGRAGAPGRGARGNARTPNPSAYRAIPGGRAASSAGRSARASQGRSPQAYAAPRMSSVRVGDLDRAARNDRARKTYRRHVVRLAILAAVVLTLAIGAAVLYFSDAFRIEEVKVEGVEHLTTAEMEALAGVPSGTTLLRVDAGAIEQNLLRDAWVKSVTVNRVFPNTLQIVITERTVAAVVEVPTQSATSTQPWAIASDGMWLMAIPDQDSELGQSISQQIYEDAASVLHITDVPYGTSPETGAFCTDENVNNALDIVAGMTTSLADQVVLVKATDAESTKLTLDNGVEIAFGKAEDIREKERVCLEIMEQNPGSVAYINVRVVDRPTWRAL